LSLNSSKGGLEADPYASTVRLRWGKEVGVEQFVANFATGKAGGVGGHPWLGGGRGDWDEAFPSLNLPQGERGGGG
jgi:hypothetical protein